MKKGILAIVVLIVVACVAVGLLIQLIPYGHNHTNPPVVKEPAWDSPQTRALAQRACFDCHSNETKWDKWYVNIAPFSWLVQRDVDEGRQRLNFSEWNGLLQGREGREGREGGEVGNVVLEGEMPPMQYLLMHPEAKLTAAEKQALADGLTASLK